MLKWNACIDNKSARVAHSHIWRSLMRWLAVFCAILPGTSVAAEATAMRSGPQLWVNPGFYSYHFDRGKGYRDNNIGVGAELLLTDDHGLLAGTFINSDGTRSRYGAYQWRPLHWQPAGLKLSAGVVISAFDGYPRYRNGAWFIAPLPTLALEGNRIGLNVALVPTIADRVHGAISFQIKLRVW